MPRPPRPVGRKTRARWQGWADPPLSAEGELTGPAAASGCGPCLCRMESRSIWISSDSPEHDGNAEILAEAAGPPAPTGSRRAGGRREYDVGECPG